MFNASNPPGKLSIKLGGRFLYLQQNTSGLSLLPSVYPVNKLKFSVKLELDNLFEFVFIINVYHWPKTLEAFYVSKKEKQGKIVTSEHKLFPSLVLGALFAFLDFPLNRAVLK